MSSATRDCDSRVCAEQFQSERRNRCKSNMASFYPSHGQTSKGRIDNPRAGRTHKYARMIDRIPDSLEELVNCHSGWEKDSEGSEAHNWSDVIGFSSATQQHSPCALVASSHAFSLQNFSCKTHSRNGDHQSNSAGGTQRVQHPFCGPASPRASNSRLANSPQRSKDRTTGSLPVRRFLNLFLLLSSVSESSGVFFFIWVLHCMAWICVG
jgi:hypothetical protein